MLIAILALGLAAAPSCKPASGDAAAVLRRAADVMGMTRAEHRVLRINGTDIITHDYESDRPYAPYLLQPSRFTEWFDPIDRRRSHHDVRIDGRRLSIRRIARRSAHAPRRMACATRPLVPSPALHCQLDASRSAERVGGRRRLDRLGRRARRANLRPARLSSSRAHARSGDHGAERLYIDQKSGYPVALERREAHYLWGQHRRAVRLRDLAARRRRRTFPAPRRASSMARRRSPAPLAGSS